MSDACKCGERRRPLKIDIPAGSNDRPRQWFVLRRNESRSAFNGYRAEWSKNSLVSCRVCGAQWSTASKVVAQLDDCEFWPASIAPKAEPFNPTITTIGGAE